MSERVFVRERKKSEGNNDSKHENFVRKYASSPTKFDTGRSCQHLLPVNVQMYNMMLLKIRFN